SFREKCPERANFGPQRESHGAEVCRLIPMFIEVFRALASRQRMFGEMQLAERDEPESNLLQGARRPVPPAKFESHYVRLITHKFVRSIITPIRHRGCG